MQMSSPIRDLLAQSAEGLHKVSIHSKVSECVELMQKENVGSLVVMDDDGKMAGIFTERDVLKRVCGAEKPMDQMMVSEVMTGNVVSIPSSTPVIEVMTMMKEKYIRHLPVQDGNDVIGMVAIRDLTYWMVDKQKEELDAMQRYINAGSGYGG